MIIPTHLNRVFRTQDLEKSALCNINLTISECVFVAIRLTIAFDMLLNKQSEVA
jgi:hypothetical protein